MTLTTETLAAICVGWKATPAEVEEARRLAMREYEPLTRRDRDDMHIDFQLDRELNK